MNASWYVSRSPHVAARRIGGEVMIMSGEDSSLYSLNETAALIWEAADGRTPIGQIVRERICAAFEVEEAQAVADALELIDALARRGILEVTASPAVPSAPSGEGS